MAKRTRHYASPNVGERITVQIRNGADGRSPRERGWYYAETFNGDPVSDVEPEHWTGPYGLPEIAADAARRAINVGFYVGDRVRSLDSEDKGRVANISPFTVAWDSGTILPASATNIRRV